MCVRACIHMGHVCMSVCLYGARCERLTDGGARQVSRADFLDYLCERYSLAKERIEVFAGANVACFSPNLAGPAAEGGIAKQ